MRKKYVAPVIAVEHYELTQTIAACDMKIGFADQNCVFNDEDATPELKTLAGSYFADGGNQGGSCARIPTINYEFGDYYDGLCYHTNANSAFTS